MLVVVAKLLFANTHLKKLPTLFKIITSQYQSEYYKKKTNQPQVFELVYLRYSLYKLYHYNLFRFLKENFIEDKDILASLKQLLD